MADIEFDYFTRAELYDKLKFTEERLDNLSIKTEPASENDKQQQEIVKTRLKTEIEQIKLALKATMAVAVPAPPVAESSHASVSNYDVQMVKTMKENATVQNLLEVVRAVPKLLVGDSIERFVSELDQIYKVEVEPQNGEISSLENEFIRAAKRLLTFSMYEQMDKSGSSTSTWREMKKYLIENHGSKITMFQHLNRLWRLELKPDEKLTDFGARLEEQAYKALLHIRKSFGKEHKNADDTPKSMSDKDVFLLITAMLSSLQVQKKHEDTFKSMIKNMDQHWSASSLMADAQDYVDRLGSNQNEFVNGAEVAFHLNKNESSDETLTNLQKCSKNFNSNLKRIQKQFKVWP